jgi:hypothetical protein
MLRHFLSMVRIKAKWPLALSREPVERSKGEMENPSRSCFDKLSMNGVSFALVRIIVSFRIISETFRVSQGHCQTWAIHDEMTRCLRAF